MGGGCVGNTNGEWGSIVGGVMNAHASRLGVLSPVCARLTCSSVAYGSASRHTIR